VSRSAAYLADVVLADRCRDGEEAAASELFRRHHKRVHATLYRVLGPNRDLEDLLQESFIQVFASLRGYRGEARLATWIDRIAARVAYRYIRGRKRQLREIELAGADGPTSPAPLDQVIARDGLKRLYAALDSLPASQRIAFALFEIDGRTVAEVAALTGSTQTTAKVRIWRARRAVLKAAAGDPLLSEFLADVELGHRSSGGAR
jgi:RNA polymerase sigma-70 factor, ECF subfamily